MLTGNWVEYDQITFLRANPDIDLAIRTNGEVASVHFGRMHPTEVLHHAGQRIKPNQLRIRVGAGVEFAIFSRLELPQVILARRWFADDFDASVRLARIKPKDQRAAPCSKINFLIRADAECPRARSLRCVELMRFARIGIDLDEEQLSAELIEIEVERLAAASVGPDNATHQ